MCKSEMVVRKGRREGEGGDGGRERGGEREGEKRERVCGRGVRRRGRMERKEERERVVTRNTCTLLTKIQTHTHTHTQHDTSNLRIKRQTLKKKFSVIFLETDAMGMAPVCGEGEECVSTDM